MAFDDPFNSNNISTDGYSSNNFNDEDPVTEFLEREKRELGDITGSDDANSNNNSLTNGGHSSVINTGNNSGSNESGSQYSALSQLDQQMNEPETIRKWREEFSTRINKKDLDEETKRKEMHEQAKKELDDFYKQRIEQMERNKEQNRVNNRILEADLLKNGNSSTSNGKINDWEKITNLCEFNPKNNRSQKDLTRYRSVLLQLKQQQQQQQQTSGK